MTEMTHKERILRAIEYKEVDRPPCFFRAEQEVNARLIAARNLASEVDLLNYYGSDAIQVFAAYNPHQLPDLKEIQTVDDVMAAPWPDSSVLDVARCREDIAAARATGLAVYGGVWSSIFTVSRYMLGEERYLLSMALDPEIISALVDRLTDYYIDLNAAYMDACAECVDVYYFGSDIGTQISMFISPDMFRTFYKPGLKRISDQAKSYGLKVMYHTCGAVTEIIDDLAGCGIDVLDPVQASATGMNPDNLAASFKGRIAFHGGISTQTTLPFGTVEQVRQETRRAIEMLGPTGYIVAPDHTIVGDTPIENIDALFEAVHGRA